MSKRCDVCGATNFESATICINCGSLFKDGAYSPNSSNVRKFKKPNSEVVRLEKSSKAMIATIASIVVIIAVIVIVCILTLGGKKSTNNAGHAITTSSGLQQEAEGSESYSAQSAHSDGYSGYSDEGSADSFQNLEITRIVADEKNVEMKIGDLKQLSVKLTPDNPRSNYIQWHSDNENVVRIGEKTNGLVCNVEAVGEGTATITVEGGDTEIAILGETITVTVVDADKLVYPEQTNDYGDYYVTANDFLYLRTGPGSDYSEILQMNSGEIVRVYAKQSDETGSYWYYVNFYGTEGWALGRFLEEYQIVENDNEE